MICSLNPVSDDLYTYSRRGANRALWLRATEENVTLLVSLRTGYDLCPSAHNIQMFFHSSVVSQIRNPDTRLTSLLCLKSTLGSCFCGRQLTILSDLEISSIQYPTQ